MHYSYSQGNQNDKWFCLSLKQLVTTGQNAFATTVQDLQQSLQTHSKDGLTNWGQGQRKMDSQVTEYYQLWPWLLCSPKSWIRKLPMGKFVITIFIIKHPTCNENEIHYWWNWRVFYVVSEEST
jgi:hypothetical protein